MRKVHSRGPHVCFYEDKRLVAYSGPLGNYRTVNWLEFEPFELINQRELENLVNDNEKGRAGNNIYEGAD